MIDENYLYLVRFNNDAFIVEGRALQRIIDKFYEFGILEIEDIGKNYYRIPFEKNYNLSWQKLYHIKRIELRGDEE